MKCFYHPQTDAVGTCSQCSKAGCHDCIEDVGGALLCGNCLELHQQAYQEQERAIAVDRAAIAGKSKAIIAIAVLLAIGGGVFGFIANPAGQNGGPIVDALSFAYGFPCIFLGVPRVWSWWRAFWKKIGCFLWATPIGWLILFMLFFYVPFVGGLFYGMLGGGIYEFARHLKIARGNF